VSGLRNWAAAGRPVECTWSGGWVSKPIARARGGAENQLRGRGGRDETRRRAFGVWRPGGRLRGRGVGGRLGRRGERSPCVIRSGGGGSCPTSLSWTRPCPVLPLRPGSEPHFLLLLARGFARLCCCWLRRGGFRSLCLETSSAQALF
jgi:hypothetical protein